MITCPFMAFLGELAALGTSVCWSFTSTFFTMGGRLVGSVVVNRTRLIMAVGFLIIAHLLTGTPLPFDAAPWRWFWLTLSGLVGLVIGDAFLFQAFVWIGPRLSMLMMSLVPVISTFIAWFFLGEVLVAVQLLGIAITVLGIAIVILDRSPNNQLDPRNRTYLYGILFGIGAAAGQALGLVLAKKGLAGDFSALSGTFIRMLSAAIILWLITLLMRQARMTFRRLREQPRSLWFITGGAFFGPFLGVTLSLFAVQNTEVGVAATLMALPPVFLLPISRFMFGEQAGRRAIIGTFVAVAGVALLALT
ncbi:MAG: DMT family transporter [Caldilineales bacterium]|nr:DMT family transporter [Caldilineales bacterium]